MMDILMQKKVAAEIFENFRVIKEKHQIQDKR